MSINYNKDDEIKDRSCYKQWRHPEMLQMQQPL
jgi:hypothetical protein